MTKKDDESIEIQGTSFKIIEVPITLPLYKTDRRISNNEIINQSQQSQHNLLIKKGDIETLKSSLETQGLSEPLILGPNGEVIDGNRRLAAMREINNFSSTHKGKFDKIRVIKCKSADEVLIFKITQISNNFPKVPKVCEIDRIISRGESLKVEFKSTMSIDRESKGQSENAFFDNVVKPICGFLNTAGGEIYIGVKENDKGEGVRHGVQNELDKFHKGNKDLWIRYLNSKLKKYFKTEYLEFITNRTFQEYNEPETLIFVIKCLPIPINEQTGNGYNMQPCSVVHPSNQGKGIERSDIYYRYPGETRKLNSTETAAVVMNRTINHYNG